MKLILPIVLGLACIGLVIALILLNQQDNTQHDADASAIVDFSNRLTTSQSQIATRDDAILTLSNRLSDSSSATLAFSNHLMDAQSTMILNLEQITNLTRQVAEAKSDNQAVDRHVLELTNQIAGLNGQIALIQANLSQTNGDLVQAYKDYSLLENRFRIDVGERIVAERKFNNPLALKAQIRMLKDHPEPIITADEIYAGLNVEVKSNGWCHVIAPN